MGHGAKVRTGTHVGDTAVEVDRRKRGALLRVADATRSCLWDGEANLGALWASLPELGGETAVSGAAPQALRLEPDPFPAGTWSQTVERYVVPGGQSSSLTVRVSLDLGRAKDDTTVAEQVAAKLAAYPTAGGWTVTSAWQAATGEGPVGLMWVKEEGGQRILTAVETLTEPWHGYLYLRPGIGSASLIPSPLITWWGLMLGLSSLARYEPVMWRDALDIDSSPAANGLEQALRTAEWRIPELVLTALTDV